MCDQSCFLRGSACDAAVHEAGPADQVLVATSDAPGIDRRAFISRSTLAAVAAVLAAACGDGVIGGSSPTAPQTLPAGGLTLRLADYPGLAQVGGIVRVDTASGPMAVVHSAATAYLAFSMVCPHQGTTVNIQGGGFVCPNHGARFSSTGQWTGGQATSNLVAFTVLLDSAAGTLSIGGTGGTPVPGQQPPPQQPGGTGGINLVVDLAQFPALARVGGVARVDGNTGTPVGAARISATQFAAYSLVCPHQGTTIGASGSGWLCPNHGARFDASGKWTGGQSTSNLVALTATYDAATNKLTITGTPPAGGGNGGGDDDDDDGRRRR